VYSLGADRIKTQIPTISLLLRGYSLWVYYSGFHASCHNIALHYRCSLPCRPWSLWNAAVSTFPAPPIESEITGQMGLYQFLEHTQNSQSLRVYFGVSYNSYNKTVTVFLHSVNLLVLLVFLMGTQCDFREAGKLNFLILFGDVPTSKSEVWAGGRFDCGSLDGD
jgi:hypothetical protein